MEIFISYSKIFTINVQPYKRTYISYIKDSYVPLEEDIHIASLVRLAATAVIKPQTAHVSQGKLKQNVGLNNAQLFQITSIENGYISNEPGLMIVNSVIKPNITGKFPVLIVNNTNKIKKRICYWKSRKYFRDKCNHS